MPMAATFGTLGEKADGLFKRVDWPSLATMDEYTGDGRKLASEGGGVRVLPRTGFAQFAQMFGHEGAVAAARLDEVTFSEDANISGRGWIADTDDGHKLATLIAAKILFHNSVDLTEVEAEYEWESDDPSDPGYWNLIGLTFTEWNIGATTIVGKPAFANARAEIVASLLSDEPDTDEIIAALQCDDEWWAEITAALESDEPLVAQPVESFSLHTDILDAIEVVAANAAGAIVMDWADFYVPESPTHQKIVVTPDGAVFGHLALWDDEHGARPGVRAPRPVDGYASFNQAGPLTERGQVETGPIFFAGGHPDHPLGTRTPDQAYGGIENAWADVRVTEGRLGPWLSGRVRPGMSEAAIHAARCSRISGHWKGNKLLAIVSVNVPAFNIPGTGLSAARGGLAVRGGELEMVASLYGPDDTPESAYDEMVAGLGDRGLSEGQRSEVRALIVSAMSALASRTEAAADEPATDDTPEAATTDELTLAVTEAMWAFTTDAELS